MNMRPHKNCSSKYLGVSWYKIYEKWRAAIQINGRQKHLGYFDYEIDAAHAYDVEAFKRDPKFCRLNFSENKTVK